MIFDEDTILLSFFEIYTDEEDLKSAIHKYSLTNCGGQAVYEEEEPVKTDLDKLDMVSMQTPVIV